MLTFINYNLNRKTRFFIKQNYFKMIKSDKVEVMSDKSSPASSIHDDNENHTDIEDSDGVDSSTEAKTPWADSIAKILKSTKPKKKKTLVLSRAKKISEAPVVKPKPVGYEIETKDGRVKKEVIIPEAPIEENKTKKLKKKLKSEVNLRVKPSILQKDRERLLMKIATKGVVQLFNAVKTQQKDIKTKLEEAGPLDVKRQKALKNIDKKAFLDVLMGSKAENENEQLRSKKAATETKVGGTWDVLRDDFMMSAKMKDWDKNLDDDDEEVEEMEIENNYESD